MCATQERKKENTRDRDLDVIQRGQHGNHEAAQKETERTDKDIFLGNKLTEGIRVIFSVN